MRPSNRSPQDLRTVKFTRNFTRHAEGSVLVEFGATQVICTASVEERVPPFLRGQGKGWVTAEYGMLPRSTGTRMQREAARGKQQGRTVEISRLIGRCLRQAVNLDALGEISITLDCDVIQADGGTRTAAISGAYVALADAINSLVKEGKVSAAVLTQQIAAVSVGIYQGQPVLDLDYIEDSNAETDLNVVMTNQGGFVEVQGTAEGAPFSRDEMNAMLQLAEEGCQQIFALQNQALAN